MKSRLVRVSGQNKAEILQFAEITGGVRTLNMSIRDATIAKAFLQKQYLVFFAKVTSLEPLQVFEMNIQSDIYVCELIRFEHC